ncbi:MAG: lytic transglycosylase domain-containing protein [Bryobacteraceae bacterium]
MILVSLGVIPVCAQPIRISSSVRADSRSGRLIRTETVTPKVIAAKPAPAGQTTRPGTDGAERRAGGALRDLVDSVALKHEVEPALVHSVIRVESNYNSSAVSNKGARGLMQLIPSTARRYGVRDSFNASENLEGGVQYLKYLLELYAGDERLALAAYNAGEGAVARWGGIPPYPETRNYVYEVGRRLGEVRRTARVQTATSVPAKREYPSIRKKVDEEGREYYTAR